MTDQLSKVFAALADPTRRDLVARLGARRRHDLRVVAEDRVGDAGSLTLQRGQELGAAIDQLEHSARVIERELEAVTDNPLIFERTDDNDAARTVVSAGNFHGMPLALTMDTVAVALCHIAGMAEAYYTPLAPHNPQGPCSLAARLQIAASIPNFLIQERGDNEYANLLAKPLPPVKDGHRPLPTDPGLGITIDEDKLMAQVGEPASYVARFDPDDGSVVDW